MQGEKQLQKAIIHAAILQGWKVAHFGNTVKVVRRREGYVTIPDKDAAGFPDLVLVRPPRLIFAELKTKNGRVSDSQHDWLYALEKVHGEIEVHIWRPKDWDSGVIQRSLK